MSPKTTTSGSELISVVAPVFNEEETLGEFHRRVVASLAGEDFELVIVDDGSRDATADVLRDLARHDERVRPIHLSRNFGHQAAVTAGIDHSRGKAVVTIDADLQDPPEFIPSLLERWRDGAQVVHGVRHVRPGEPRLRLLAIRIFYRLFRRMSGLRDFPGSSGDFRLMDRAAVVALQALPERNRFVRGLVSWIGFRQEQAIYERNARFAGSLRRARLPTMRQASELRSLFLVPTPVLRRRPHPLRGVLAPSRSLASPPFG